MITTTLVICVGAILIPYQISVLIEKLGSYSSMNQAFFPSYIPTKNRQALQPTFYGILTFVSEYNSDLSYTGITGHVICCGYIEYNSLLDFLLEFYHEVLF